MENCFRLHIDIPLGYDEQPSVDVANKLVDYLLTSETVKNDLANMGISVVNYRVGHDSDRQKSNYLVKTESGHVTHKKCKIELK